MPHQPTSVLNNQPDIHYIHSDHLNTPQRITNTTQQTVWAADYQPFGQATLTTASITNPLRFPGQYYDEETNLHYNYFRDYDPTTGRYIQSDPIGLDGGLNTYGYVGGNPLGFVDPEGLAAQACLVPPIGAACVSIGQLVVDAVAVGIGMASLMFNDSVQIQDRVIPQPAKPKRGVTCTCRASSSGQQEGNCPEDEFAFGTATASTKRQARAEAERIARKKLGKQAKHTQCKCTDNKGNSIR